MIELNWIKIKNGMQIGKKGISISSCEYHGVGKKTLKIHKFEKALLHASWIGNGLNKF